MTTTVNSSTSTTSSSNITYVNSESEKDKLQDSFLEILIAQLQNQDPLNPVENTEFTSQLAQFYQLEEVRSSNEYLKTISESMGSQNSNSAKDPYSYLGAEVTAQINDYMYMQNGGISLTGKYILSETGTVRVNIYNSSGALVRTIETEEDSTGTKTVDWDGLDSDGNTVSDGSYSYEVLLTNGNGTKTITDTATGTIENIIFQGNDVYFTIRQADDSIAIANSNSLKMVTAPKAEGKDDTSETNKANPIEYIGGLVKVSQAYVEYEGSELEFFYNIEGSDEVNDENYVSKINILDSDNNVVKTLSRNSDNKFVWDGTDSSGNKVDEGIYRYATINASGVAVENSIQGQVQGVYYKDNKAYLNVLLYNSSDSNATDSVLILPELINELGI